MKQLDRNKFNYNKLITSSHRVAHFLLLAFSLSIGFTQQAVAASYDLLLSTSTDRSNAAALNGATVVDNIYVFTSSDTGISRVRFYLDDPTASGAPRQTEGSKPYDFAGTNSNKTAKPFDTRQIADGNHTITAKIDLSTGGSQTVSANFVIANNGPIITSSNQLMVSASTNRSNAAALSGETVVDSIYVFTGSDSSISKVRFYLDDPTASGAPYQTERNGPYDFAGTNRDNTAKAFDTRQIADGSHTITAQIDLSTGGIETVNASFVVANNTVAAAQPTTRGVGLSWNAPTMRADGSALSMSEIAGYVVHYGTAAGSYPNAVDIPDAYTMQYTFSNLSQGTYYFVVTAYDTTGRVSSYSSSISTQVQ